ncbi:hypothetical protein LCGC14_1285490 [marine sediment metagenome]|uniref:Uncharacterized protein n=1 Tax=marine sediment metagenome TaxID=412755 RepID=A0A0F9KVM4_9ZZZZ
MTERTKSLLGIAAAAAITLGPSAGTAAAASYAGASTLTAIAVGATTSGILLGILVTITMVSSIQTDLTRRLETATKVDLAIVDQLEAMAAQDRNRDQAIVSIAHNFISQGNFNRAFAVALQEVFRAVTRGESTLDIDTETGDVTVH